MTNHRFYSQEDAQISNTAFGPERALFGVFDGHGGKEVAHYCKKHYEQALGENTDYKSDKTLDGLKQSFLKMDDMLVNGGGLKEVGQLRKDEPPNKSPLLKVLTEAGPKEGTDEAALDSIGCTANVVLVDHNRRKLYVANAGDSRAVMGQGGKAVPLSFDHKPED